jgi:sigma-B regulation protein RsbQ
MSVTKHNNVKIFGSGRRTMVLAHGFGDQHMRRCPAPLSL